MATTAKRSPFVTPRSSRAYRLEMEGRTILFLVSLLILTGLVLFSLGVVAGMGMRDPAAEAPLATAPAPEPETPPPGETLSFNEGVNTAEPVIEGLQRDQGQASGHTEKLLKQAEKVLTLEEVPSKSVPNPGASVPNPPPAASAPQAATPEASPPAAQPPASTVRYAVQVFSSRHRSNAQELVARLKKLGFSPYLNQYQSSDGTTWYRVRVGKNPRPEAEQLVRRLRDEANMKAPQIVRL